MSRPAVLTLVAIAVLISPATPAEAQPAGSQFTNFVPAPYGLDNVQGEWINLETQLIKPILVTADERFVVVANEPDNRVEVLTPNLSTTVAEIVLGQGIAALAERPPMQPISEPGPIENNQDHDTQLPEPIPTHEIWVSLRHQSSVAVIDTLNWRLKALLRPPIGDFQDGALTADTPGGIAFNAAGTKAYVAASSSDAVVVYDAVQKSFLTSISLASAHNGTMPTLNDPMSLVTVGNKVYVTSHNSGNQTIVDSLNGQTIPGAFGPGPLNQITVLDITNDPAGRSLPDFDIMEIDTSTDLVSGVQKGVGSTLFGIDYHPPTGLLITTSTLALNGFFIGEGSFPSGRVLLNRLSGILPGSAPSTYIHIITENLGPAGDHVVMPTDMEVDSRGNVYLAGYASANIGAWSPGGAYLGVLQAGSGPRGLAYAPRLDRLYVLNRADNTVAYYDVSGGVPTPAVQTVTLVDPTYDRVKSGRRIFLDPTHSGFGTTGCFSCHQDLRKDGLGWHLSKFFDLNASFSNGSSPNWKDLKGVMVTQDLRSLIDNAPYHWRGEQKDLEDFNGAFVDLLKGTTLSPTDFDLFKAYTFSANYPPNPNQRMNRVFSTQAIAGHTAYMTNTADGTNCNNCHLLPTGTDAAITEALIGSPGSTGATKTTQLRGTWTKESAITDIDPGPATALWPSTGFGFFHEGSLDSVQEFNDFFFTNSATPITQQQSNDITKFVAELDTGLGPCALYSERLFRATATSNRIGTYMINQADSLIHPNSANCDLVAHGRLRLSSSWQNVGLVYDRVNQNFVPDLSTLGTFTWSTLQSMALAGDADLLFLGVPYWSGERIGVDRDRDGVFDGDEQVQGLDPTHPDTDGDGLWDSYDPQPLANPNNVFPVGAPQVVPGSLDVIHTTSNSVKIVYETDTFSPTRVEFGPTANFGYFSGDPFPLPLPPAGASNHWKRRHTVFLRPQPGQQLFDLSQSVLYHFRIHTQGQNGQTAVSNDFFLDPANQPTAADLVAPIPRISAISLTSQRVGSQVNYTATLLVTNNTGTIAPNITINTRFTFYTGTTILSQVQVSGTSDAFGSLVLTASNQSQVAGDLTVFDIPFYLQSGMSIFSWPEGQLMRMTMAP